MKIFVTGDTHSDLSEVMEMYNAITSERAFEGIPHVDRFDYLIHCGDYRKDASELSRRLGLPAVCVYGNCDDVWEADFDILDTPAGSIVVTHGHVEDVNNTHDGLYALAEDQGCNCICYGHTHIPVYGEENGYLVINPGSPAKPLDGTKGSCAILTADENGYSGEIVYYQALLDGRKAAKSADSDDGPKSDDSNDSPKSDDSENGPKSDDSKPAAKPAPKKSGSFGGFLRKIFNYSDGQ